MDRRGEGDDIGQTTDVAVQDPEVVRRVLEDGESARIDLGDSANQRVGRDLRRTGRVSLR
jgi:hypothetical protein